MPRRIGCAMRNAMSAARRVAIPAPDTTSAACRPRLARYSDGNGGLASRAPRGGSNSAASARPVLGPGESATVRERLVAELPVINTADEAAVWAQRNLPVKDTLTAGDAKILEERFQARLSAISEGHAPDGTTSADRKR